MSKSEKPNRRIQVIVSEEAYNRLQEIANHEGIRLADFARDAIQRRCGELGFDIEVGVGSWGGKRPRSGRK